MKKLITIVLSCSLALVAGAMAQQNGEESPAPKKQQGKAHAAQPQARPQAAQPPTERPAARQHAAKKAKEENAANANNNAPAPAKAPAANAKANAQAGRHNKKEQNATKAPATATQAETEAAAPQANTANAPAKRTAGQPAKKPDVKVVQKIKEEHVNFHAQPKPAQVPSVTFSQSRRIEGADRWQGERYSAFRSYHPEMHDERFYRSHYSRIELIGGGYYYFNGGYWYPAWGYRPSASYYAYDGPIYAGARAEPPDRVIADVQAVLQQQGYYTGEVDGLLGPLTRQALTGYQNDNGLYATAAIDEPTLASLGMD